MATQHSEKCSIKWLNCIAITCCRVICANMNCIFCMINVFWCYLVPLKKNVLKMNGWDFVFFWKHFFLKMIITLNNDEIISSFWLAVMWGCSQCYSFDNNLLLYLMNSLKLRNSWIQTNLSQNGSKSFFALSCTRLRSHLVFTIYPLLKLGT